MSDNAEVFKLKKRVRYYDKQSFGQQLDQLLARHADGSIEKHQRMPSLVYLLLEWLFEVENKGTPKIASARDITWFMNRLWQLNDSNFGNNNIESVTLFLRPLINNQFWIQHSKAYWLRGLVLQHALMFPMGKSPFNDEFFQATKITLSDYFHITAAILVGMDNERRVMNYFEVVKALHPHFSIDTIAKAIRVFAMFPEEIERFLSEKMPRENAMSIINADTRLIHCPVILNTRGLYTPDHALLRRGLSESAFNHFLRINRDGFRMRYGDAYENYVRGCLIRDDVSFDSEDELKLLYKEHRVEGKVVDAVAKATDGVVFVEAKGVVPKVETMITAEPRLIKHHLKDTVIRAAKQIIECAFRLEQQCYQKLPEKAERYGLIVTQGEYYLKRFSNIAKHIAADTISNLESKFGQPIPYENIFVCNINDFDYLTGTEATCEDFFVSFMQHCKEEDADTSTSKMLMLQHIESFFKKLESQGQEYARARETAVKNESLFTALVDIVKANVEYWNSKSKTELLEKGNDLRRAVVHTVADQL